MKRLFTYLIIGLLIWGCAEKNPKPKDLISEKNMEEILYDLTLLQAIRNNNYMLFEQNNIQPDVYIYQKYEIDSLQFASSHKYYISDPENYEKILTRIIDRVNENKKTADSLKVKEEEKPVVKDSLSPKVKILRKS